MTIAPFTPPYTSPPTLSIVFKNGNLASNVAITFKNPNKICVTTNRTIITNICTIIIESLSATYEIVLSFALSIDSFTNELIKLTMDKSI